LKVKFFKVFLIEVGVILAFSRSFLEALLTKQLYSPFHSP